MPARVLHDVLSAAVQRLRAAGIDPAAAAGDVDVLARHVLGWDRARLLAHRLDAVPGGFVDAFTPLLNRRTARVPVAYLTGQREFYGLAFEVSPDVLIPRPETEFAVDAALASLPAARPAHVVDVGTGSGCIAVALAVTRPDVRVLAVDQSRAALRVAARNVSRHEVAGRVALVAGDLLAAVGYGAADVIVSNPPYVPAGSRDLAPDVADHEPAGALYAGPDGLDVVRRLIEAAPRRLRPGGVLLLEIGSGQAGAVAGLVEASSDWSGVTFRTDLQGIPRLAMLVLRPLDTR